MRVEQDDFGCREGARASSMTRESMVQADSGIEWGSVFVVTLGEGRS